MTSGCAVYGGVAHPLVPVHALQPDAEAPQAGDVLDHFLGAVVQGTIAVADVAQGEGAVAPGVDVPHLDVRLAPAQVVLPRQRLAQAAIAVVVVDGRDLQLRLRRVVQHREHAHLAHQLGRQVLADEALVLEVPHRVVERLDPVAARDVGEPRAVLVGGVLADAADVGEHREAQRIGVDAAVRGVRDRRLEHHVGVRAQDFHHVAVREHALVVHGVQQRVVPERGPALVHHLRLPLRVEVLRHLAHDAHHLALPRLQQGRVLLDEVQDVLLRLLGEALGLLLGLLAGLGGQRAPQVVDLLLQVGLAVLAAVLFLHHADLLRPAIAVDAVVHQRVAGVQRLLHRLDAVALLAFGDVALGIDQVVDDRAGIRPHAEQVVPLEERVVPEARMRHHQRLHRHRVLLHEIGDARVGVDDDLVGQAHVAAAVALLALDEMLAVGPVAVVHRHADGGVGVQHLFGGDHLQLRRVGVQPEALRGLADLVEVQVDQLEVPVRRAGQARPLAAGRGVGGSEEFCCFHHAAAGVFLNRSRKTGKICEGVTIFCMANCGLASRTRVYSSHRFWSSSATCT
ncbi:MAG: hypothetical protein K0S48_1299 [Ramlibacter sp.]|nr:hypothetical protein [Ramlibacter sp.]